jgi:polyhydroxyalkanoate synthesis regulator protein
MIKLLRYKNRKIYLAGTGKYVTSTDVVDFLKNSLEVEVVSHATGEVITQSTLTNMGAAQISKGNIEAGNLLIKHASGKAA